MMIASAILTMALPWDLSEAATSGLDKHVNSGSGGTLVPGLLLTAALILTVALARVYSSKSSGDA